MMNVLFVSDLLFVFVHTLLHRVQKSIESDFFLQIPGSSDENLRRYLFQKCVVGEATLNVNKVLNLLCWTMKCYSQSLKKRHDLVSSFILSFSCPPKVRVANNSRCMDRCLCNYFQSTLIPNPNEFEVHSTTFEKNKSVEIELQMIENDDTGGKDMGHDDDFYRFRMSGLIPLINVLTCPMGLDVVGDVSDSHHKVNSSIGTGFLITGVFVLTCAMTSFILFRMEKIWIIMLAPIQQ